MKISAALFFLLSLTLTASAAPPKTHAKKPPVKKPVAAKPTPPVVNPNGPPTLPANFAVRPSFQFRNGTTLEAGTAFGATVDGGPPLLLSALHLFGPAGGLKGQIPASRVGEFVSGVKVYDMSGKQQIGDAGASQLSEGEAMNDESGDVTGDLTAFSLPKDTKLGVAPLAKENPPLGSRVWLVGKVRGQAGATADLFGGTVAQDLETLHMGRGLCVKMDSDAFDFAGFSGGPVVNARGEVVGVVIGGIAMTLPEAAGVQIYTTINPARSLRRLLSGFSGQ